MIKIKKSETADTRTCNVNEVTKEQLLESSKSHIDDVAHGLQFFEHMINDAKMKHDHTKISYIDAFYKDFKNNFETTEWWKMHQKEERHHFNNPEFVQDDINLIDVLEQIADGVMAGMARSGKYRFEPLSNELLQKAYHNTAKLLLENVEVVEE